MSMTTYEMARVLEQLEDAPEKVMFGKLLNELGNQSGERIRSAAKQVPLHMLRDIVYQFQQVVEDPVQVEAERVHDRPERMARRIAPEQLATRQPARFRRGDIKLAVLISHQGTHGLQSKRCR